MGIRFGFAAVVAASFTLTGIAAADPITVVSWGGSYGQAQDNALFNDASANSGIEIIRESGASMSKTCLQVESGAVTWDLVVTGSGGAAAAAAKGCLEKIDFGVVDVSDFYPTTYTDYCVGSDVFATVFSWNTAKYGAPGSDGAPANWADFWDVEKFPGTRAYRANNVDGALEPALLADGVAPEDVYDVLATREGKERAINKIRELKPHIAVFWESGAMQAQLMKDEEVDMTTGWNGRFDNAAKDGATVGYTFNQALLDYDCFAMPKGAPNKDVAMKFLAEVSKPEYQANLPFHITYGPTNKKAYDVTTAPKELIEALPSHPKNVPLMLPISLDWYAEHRAEALEMYIEMLSE
ncbi:ABC transporter, periplasmic spermidine putrescine-binding protein PotD [Candidatus Rhodobacter oscarellae]|uniref:ABC transporter, periplasmic spermidine putrescine-binding protein PotD n=1 Tax=Candidatus Rhodobacter oscarellae TaxID=1675527 RepID=A0A0J9E9S4_9RHOB|nr:ABC transporter, periplasmic spermidine putrescine-binding protein PotD [Candidatus Rhodobacter lobularis]